ncbi:hypothetical protein [Dactylosporangium matsuzakiense]|uniref:Uncharacterized protein n=1 Tax=Dactylosporangium matsuzakiense TaxID=53360 RepID=A0A9W6NNY1_9ACTN|nr:hypothetical protein [Dactylosporangium matsuzakiense]GLL03716.1 hypothetical protein GCM10017581_054620 [Dactylosporangium matsuzakiense]
MPIILSTGVTIRTVTFWYPATHLGIDDWAQALAVLFDEDLRPDARLFARTGCGGRAVLAAPRPGRPTRCAGGRLDQLDLAGTTAAAKREAASRHAEWCRSSTIRRRRPGPAETALLQAGRRSYLTYHSLRRVVGDALISMHTGCWRFADAATPDALVGYVQAATSMLSAAAPDDVLVTVTT